MKRNTGNDRTTDTPGRAHPPSSHVHGVPEITRGFSTIQEKAGRPSQSTSTRNDVILPSLTVRELFTHMIPSIGIHLDRLRFVTGGDNDRTPGEFSLACH